MNLNKDTLLEKIGQIVDPDLDTTLAELKAIKDISTDGDKVKVELELIQPFHLIADSIKEACEGVIAEVDPAAKSEIIISEQNGDYAARKVLPTVKNIIAVSSGKGGVGKSTIAANLAVSLSKTGAKVGILDADVYGPSQPTMFGNTGGKLEAEENESGDTKAIPLEAHGIKIASMGYLMQDGQAAIVRGPMLAQYFTMLVEQVKWDDLDYLVLDLPPGTGDIQLTMTQKIPLTGAVIITTPQEIAVVDVRRSIAMFQKVNVDILGIVENMSYFTPPELPENKYYIFGNGGGKKVAEKNSVAFLGEIPIDPALREAADSGTPLVLSAPDSNQSEALNDLAHKTIVSIRKNHYNNVIYPDMEITM